MKGIVFTEFLELVESKFGLETVNEIIEKSELKSNGAYTAIGTYDFAEMLSLISNLSEKTKITIHDLLYTYGLHFFKVLEESYPGIIKKYKSPIDMLASIDSHIHVENKPDWSFVKLYSHGIQSPELVTHHLGPMLDELKAETTKRNIKLHYVSAREAYNIVRAAQAGMTGDPEAYRDYIYKAPLRPAVY